ncbi:arginine/serine-rich protein PNISR isoform X2 [Lates japonicus]|uniref:Arginine/serine-rich protein PNISR isoform X2 n=1 Tax=Lates japonicus TaxID=270547 RepID=A0AAD3M744_LATJO|nr:arginine/serine-rich protein PNISR isoform X2 [Lates japonicus]
MVPSGDPAFGRMWQPGLDPSRVRTVNVVLNWRGQQQRDSGFNSEAPQRFTPEQPWHGAASSFLLPGFHSPYWQGPPQNRQIPGPRLRPAQIPHQLPVKQEAPAR